MANHKRGRTGGGEFNKNINTLYIFIYHPGLKIIYDDVIILLFYTSTVQKPCTNKKYIIIVKILKYSERIVHINIGKYTWHYRPVESKNDSFLT
jgi:hypothetical protein